MAPKTVFPVPRLEADLLALKQLFSSHHPIVRHVRSHLVSVVLYGFGDASGLGFGSSIQTNLGLRIRHGIWGSDAKNKSSNYKELRNIVETIEADVRSGFLSGSELFIFTDNIVDESCFYRETSSSRHLFNLIFRLRKAEMDGGLKLHVLHVAGTRMIQQGTDVISRGNMLEGVMAGADILEFVTLHQTAVERSDTLLNWLKDWAPPATHILRPDEWFDLGHGIAGGAPNEDGVWIPTYMDPPKIWVPPPAAAAEAVEELSKARHMNPTVPHLFVVPRLVTYLWRKQLMKVADTVLYVKPGSKSFWPHDMHEPLLIGIILPFSRYEPWQLRRSSTLLELERKLRRVWEVQDADERVIFARISGH